MNRTATLRVAPSKATRFFLTTVGVSCLLAIGLHFGRAGAAEPAVVIPAPALDEPAAGIQLLLAPAFLAGELARTAVHAVKRSLEHVPLASVPKFLEPPTAKPLKIGVFKELVRIIATYIELPEMQDLVRRLWGRPLHQDGEQASSPLLPRFTS